MAWTEVCRVNFCQTVKHMTVVKKLKLKTALQKLSSESGIPVSTLKKWFYSDIEEKSTKNGTFTEDIENTKEILTTEEKKSTSTVCRACNSEVESFKITSSGKPYGPKSKFYRLCQACAKQSERVSKIQSDDGISCVCPHCGEGFSIPWSTVKSRLRKYEEGLKNGKEN